jgi:Smr domain
MSSKRDRKPMKLVNLELNRPTVPLALSLLDDALRIARQERYAAVKIIHGYGSSGVGGDIRLAVQRVLAQQAAAKQIHAFIPGEDWRISNEHTWALLQAHWALKNDSDLNRGNKGISIVVL